MLDPTLDDFTRPKDFDFQIFKPKCGCCLTVANISMTESTFMDLLKLAGASVELIQKWEKHFDSLKH